ncbi:MAG: hypothetical protein V1791_01305 [Pseudomonadota bacterium]
MMTTFRILFTINVSHGYYIDNCRDFDFVVPTDTGARLRNGKMLAKMRDGMLHVLYEADDAGTALVSIAGTGLRFGLKLRNPLFSNITDFTIPTPLYRNSLAADSLAPAMDVAMTGRLISHAITRNDRPVTVTVNAPTGQPLQVESITAGNDRSTVSIDLTGQAPGLYRVTEQYPDGLETVLYYFDAELQQDGIFGLVEIMIDSGFYNLPPSFTINFNAKQETIKYYLIASNHTASELNHLAVVDNGFSEEGRSRINFTKIPSSSFTSDEIPAGMIAKAGDRVVLFKSQTVVARQEKARRKIQLSRNGDVLIKHLPQPGADKTSADMIIHISRP